MKKEKESNMISGIHNYCDSWCEHCEFTQQCATFVPNQKATAKSDEQMWDVLAESLSSTIQMVRDWAEKNGVDLDSIDYAECERDEEQVRKQADSFECSILSKKYIDLTKAWLDSNKYIFEDVKKTKCLDDSLEIIYWYKHLIYVKLMRAATGQVSDWDTGDSNGSAKVALIGIDRSIGAWGTLFLVFSEQEDELLDILVLLERLRRVTESEFPKARDFIRPGFDE